MNFSLICIVFLGCISLASAKECIDGVDNVIALHDLHNKKGSINFNDLKMQTYDAKLRPTCDAIHIPGYFKIASGEIEIVEPLHESEDSLRLELTIEQNSFMVGQVCEKGESKNAFIPNEVCNFDLCSLMEDFCKLFETKGVFGIKDLPTDYRDFIAIGPVTIPQVEGEWKAELAITQTGKAKAGVRLGDGLEDSWTYLKLGSDADIKAYEETEKKRKEGAIPKEEL